MEINNPDFTILIVDDVDANVLLLRLLISKAGFRTITASSGREALKIIKETPPDLILLDIMMPDMDGYEVAKELSATENYSEIPIIFLSALNSSEDIVKGFKLGAADYVSKPFNKDELLIRVNHQISLIAAKRTISKQTEELRKTILGRDKLYSVIAHDLRSPVASIRMVMNALVFNISKESIAPDMYELLTMANRLTDECYILLDNLLKWTKSQTGKLQTVFQDGVDLNDLINGVLEVTRSVAELKNITVNYSDCDPTIVRIDIDMIKTVLRNLLSNAIKFSHEGSPIELSVLNEGERVIISVKDSGTGISEEHQENLFKVDVHYTSFGTNNEEGSGLGLLICKDFIERNGGELWFESKQGEGSIFSFSIPIQQ